MNLLNDALNALSRMWGFTGMRCNDDVNGGNVDEILENFIEQCDDVGGRLDVDTLRIYNDAKALLNEGE